MTNLDVILNWAPDYPWAFSSVQVRAATGLPCGKINLIMHAAAKYDIIEVVGVIDGLAWWRKTPPEGTEARPVVFHPVAVPVKPFPRRVTSTDRLRAWVEGLPVGTRFKTSDAFEATGVSDTSVKLRRFTDILEIADRNGRTFGRITWRRVR